MAVMKHLTYSRTGRQNLLVKKMESKTNNLYLGVSEHFGIIWYNPNHAYENYDKHRENSTQKCSNKSPLFLLHDIYRASCRS